MMDHNLLRQRYLDFFKTQGHEIIPPAKIVSENDSTTLFTSAGMQPMLPYLLGQDHPMGRRLVDSQPCFRSEDIDEIGDNRHSTFFEMLGNWSLGSYFKKEQLTWLFQFLTEMAGLDPQNLYATVFNGDEEKDIPKDNEAARIWQNLFETKGIVAKELVLRSQEEGSLLGMQDSRIFFYDSAKNWWSRSGIPSNMPAGEPGGPDSEVFYRFPNIEHNPDFGAHCHPNCDCGQFLEIGNSVFMEYMKEDDGSFSKLDQRNIDFGGGLIRILAAQANNPDIYETSLFQPLISKICNLSGLEYKDEHKISMRIIADHLTASTFMVSQGLQPSNKLQGYVLRRLIRRTVSQAHSLGIKVNFTDILVGVVADIYQQAYPDIKKNISEIKAILSKEEEKFKNTLKSGLNVFNKLIGLDRSLGGEDMFNLYQSYGFPAELSLEIAQGRDIKIEDNAVDQFDRLLDQHQQLSRQTSAGMFKGGLADSSVKTTQYHTLTHLLNATLREILGEDISQKGSNITAERLRFDFNYPTKLTSEQIDQIEIGVNNKIAKKLEVTFEDMPISEAHKKGAIGVFGEKYPDIVRVYTIVDKDDNKVYSMEICGGPHIKSAAELTGRFKVIKEESASSGVRRIKAVLA